ncbi:MAG: hypothetical protein AAFU73_13875 [Planctomycetota bacterium]
MRPIQPLLILLALLGALGLAPAARSQEQETEPAPDAYVMAVEGALNAGHLALFQRAVRTAEADGAALVVRFDTPGGELTRMKQFANAIDAAVESGLPVYGFVDDEASSAGVWLAIACESLYMRQRATIGSAQVVTFSAEGMQPAPEKIRSNYRAWVRAWAEAHGRDPLLAQAMIDVETEVRRVRTDAGLELISGDEWNDLVDRGEAPELVRTIVPAGEMAAFTGEEAVRLGFADALAESVDEVLAKQGLAGGRVQDLGITRREQWLAQLWSLRLLFLFLGLFFGYVELKMPGFGVPGVLSLLAFGIMFTGQYLVGLADVPHIVMAVLGLLLVAAELFVLPGLIWPGLIGALLLIAGLLMSQVGPGVTLSSAWDREILLDASWQLTLTATVALLAIWGVSRFLPKTPVLGRLVLAGGAGTMADALPEARETTRSAPAVGARGQALTALRPVGKVTLDGDAPGVDHEARAESGLIEPGARVRVVEVQSGRLVVAADQDDGQGGSA